LKSGILWFSGWTRKNAGKTDSQNAFSVFQLDHFFKLPMGELGQRMEAAVKRVEASIGVELNSLPYPRPKARGRHVRKDSPDLPSKQPLPRT
jgi:hypothetical protein